MTTKEFLLPVRRDLRIVLIGRVGAGKTAVMNTILRGSEENGKPASETQICFLSDTQKCQKEKVQIGKHIVVIVDTPGLCHADKPDEEVVDEIKKGISLAAPGPHVFLFVLDLERFTQEEEGMVEIFWNTFGKNAAQYSMVLFTHENDLKKKGKTIKQFIEESKELQNFVSMCKGGYHVIDNKNHDPSQVTELLQQMDDMVQKNGEKAYTCEMMEVAEKEGKSSGIKKKIALSVNGSALAGAGVGAAATYFVGSSFGIPVGAAAGAAVGGVMGGLGIVASQYIKLKKCVIQ